MRRLALLLPCLSLACGGSDGGAEGGHALPVVALDSVFEPLGPLELEASPENPLERVAGVAFGPDGRLAVSDPVRGVVSVYDRSGRLLHALGGPGTAPGSLQVPSAPLFDVEGRVHVVDRAHQKIVVYGTDGAPLRDTPLADRPFLVTDWALDPRGGGYLLAGLRGDGGVSEMLFEVDAEGAVTGSSMPMAGARPAGEPASPLWQVARSAQIATVGDTVAFLVSTLDSVWFVPPGGAPTATAARPEGYEPPALPREELADREAVRGWNDGVWRMTALEAGDGFVLAPASRGVYHDGGASPAAYRGPDGTWRTIPDLPPVVGVSGDTVAVLVGSAGGGVAVELLRHRRGAAAGGR